MTEALEIRVVNLLSELLAHTFCILVPLSPARTIAARSLQTLPYNLYGFLVGIKSNLHCFTAFIIEI